MNFNLPISIRIAAVLLFLGSSFQGTSQTVAQSYSILIRGDDSFENLSRRKFATASQAREAAMNVYSQLLSSGYLNCRLDTSWNQNQLVVNVDPGAPFLLILQTPGAENSMDETLSRDFGLVRKEANRLISIEENRGYPFARVTPLCEPASDSSFQCQLNLERGPFFAFDSLIIKGDGKNGGKFLQHYLRFRKGMPYEEKWFQEVALRTSEVPFLRMTRAPEVLFREGKASCYIYTERKNANSFSGILGIQPNEATGRTNITGDLELNLVNSLNGGEEFYLNWRKLQPQTQDLKVKLLIPFIAGLPVGTEGKVEIFRRDSSFTQLKTALSLMHFMGGAQYVKIFVERTALNQLNSFATAGVLANVDATMYGTALKLERLDYRFNPRKGWATGFEIAAGKKDTRQGDVENAGTVAYEQYRINLQAEVFIPVMKRQCFRVGATGGILESPVIYTNEMYRLGGIRNLRGFDEESIFASSYSIASLEYRFLFDRNSNLLLFFDQAWYERQEPGRFETDTPYGFGAGVNFETRAGIFAFTYGLGSQFDNPILLRNGKIGFGFRNTF